jgi:hypothetical protein
MWLHADMLKYEKEYALQIKKTPGMHIDGSETFQPAYAEYPALFPKDQWFRATEGRLEYVNGDEKAVCDDIDALVAFCLERKIIRYNDRSSNYEVHLLAKKPDAESPETARLLEIYCNDPYNVDENELYKSGSHLFDYMLEKYGCDMHPIMALGTVRSNEEKNLGWLIRRQMHLVKLLRDERSYILSENSIFGKIDAINKVRVGQIRMKDFFRLMVYGLVAAGERGAWSYRLGDRPYPIVSKLQVSESDPSMVANMEMAAYEAFYKLPDQKDHMVLLKQNISRINISIDSGDLPVSVVLDNCTEYARLADSKLDAYLVKQNRGENLTAKEQELKSFYALLKATCEEIRSVLV